MKRKTIIIICAVLSVILVAGVVISFISYRNGKLDDLFISRLSRESSKHFVYDGKCRKENVKTLTKEFNSLPDKTIEQFNNSEWTIILTTKNLSEKLNTKYLTEGITDGKEKRIYINENVEIKRVLRHEIGHFFDYENGLPSQTDEFIDISDAEREKFKEEFNPLAGNVNARKELFAESFYVFLTEPEHLKNACPQIYKYLNALINK